MAAAALAGSASPAEHATVGIRVDAREFRFSLSRAALLGQEALGSCEVADANELEDSAPLTGRGRGDRRSRPGGVHRGAAAALPGVAARRHAGRRRRGRRGRPGSDRLEAARARAGAVPVGPLRRDLHQGGRPGRGLARDPAGRGLRVRGPVVDRAPAAAGADLPEPELIKNLEGEPPLAGRRHVAVDSEIDALTAELDPSGRHRRAGRHDGQTNHRRRQFKNGGQAYRPSQQRFAAYLTIFGNEFTGLNVNRTVLDANAALVRQMMAG